MSAKSYDVAVIGGGPGGYVAAIRASQLGKKVVLIEANHLGGICLNWGCIPTKTLLRSAEVADLMRHAESFGIESVEPKINFGAMIQRSRGVASQLSSGIKHLMKKNKVDVIDGYAQLAGKNGPNHKIQVKDGDTVEAKTVILATGARAKALPSLPIDGKNVWSYREAMTPESLPNSLLVVGSGAIGIEFASFYRALGVSVTVVEIQDRILPVEDKEISTLAQKAFESRGIQIRTNSSIETFKPGAKGIEVVLKTPKGSETLSVDHIISAVGIQGNSENLGLEKTKVKLEKGHVMTDKFCQTAEPGIYAIGDLTGAPWLAHKASHEGVLAVEHALGLKGLHPMKKENIPGCTYSTPQIASIGLTEEAAKARGPVKVGRFPFMGNGKAIALGEPQGLVKTIFDEKTGELLGAHMIGCEVTEMIQGFAIAKSMEATEADLMHTIFPHPTLSEMMHESVLDAFGRALHM